VAVKKKAATKKVAKKKVVKKAPAKKKAAAKKVTKKAPAKKKTAAKKVAKKAPAKKKTAAKKVAKKVAKKAPAKKKSSVKKSTSASKIVIPPVPLGGAKGASRVNVSTTPAPAKPAPAKPSAAPKQGTSPRVLIAAIIGIALLAIVVISRPASDSDTAAPVATESAAPEMTEEATPEMTEEATPEATEPATTEPVAAVEAPGRFIGNWKDAEKSVMVITWRAPAATAGLTGYKFEIRSGMGEWKESGMLPATQLSIEFTKGSADSSTSFRVSSVYSDGQIATAKAFGFSGQFA
jgi:hypothetical protein